MKWPVFAGDAGEDFFKFKKDFLLYAAKQNRTSTRNQITKLRENLRGYAKTLVPTSISDISKGLDILEHACGDSMKVVTHRVNNLLKVGPWPQEGSKECYSRQIKWIISVQTNLQEIIELANAEEELGDIIYNREKLAQILKLFPSFIVDKVVKMPGYKEKKYKEIIAKLDEVKKVSQNRELIYGPGGGVSGSGGDSKNQGNNQAKADKLPTGHTFFPQPKKYDDCRICKVLQAQGGSSGLFLNHISDYATGCPLFASLGTEQRFVVVKEAKLCPRCMGKDVTTSRDHFTKCPVLKKKNSYSCKSEKCTFHMWLCSRHPDANKEQMQKFEEQLRTKSGIRLVFMAGKRKVRAPSVSSDNNPVPTEGTCDLPHLKPPDPSPHSPVLEPTSPDVANPPPSDTITPGSPHSYCAKSQLGIKRAVRKMNRFNKKSDPGVETVSPPEGSPLFMFQPVEGLQEPVNLFYDCGASEAIFRQGIPGKQLRGTMLAKGPFSMGGVGDIATMAEEEWLIQLNRCDNKKQLVRGVTMKQITCCFPPIDTTKAVEEVKSSDKDDQFLQSCNIPDIAGGHVDVLLGIQYLSIFPPIVRQLDCGLTIFESRLVSHNKKMNAIIGGPHTSFQFLAEKAGNTAKLLAHFTEGLMNLRKLGPPRIPVNPLSQEDEIFAKAYNMEEQQEIFDLASKEKTGDDSGFCFCLFSDDSPDKLREIKNLRLEQECGVDINYRCVKCRDCTACRDSDRVESISLREEAEMELIDQSVKLDLVNKKIICSLPLKGEEKQFLTNNYNQAMKVLDQQVKQYSKQENTKELIIAAFNKLFDNGHASLLKDLTDDEKALFLNKEIQYFIPWRLAFSDSVSTPARPVLDASSRTKLRSDGTGGKSLNDLVCKGKVETLNLLKLILNFRIGKFAMTGDLQQFYNACKLLPHHWNLQRFLYKPDLDPSSPAQEGVIKTLIYGVSSVSAQSENSMKKLGNVVKDSKPDVKKLIDDKRFCDDIGDSKPTVEECVKLAKDADDVFSMVSLSCKSWSFSNQDPDPKVSKDGVSLGVAGCRWFPKLDVFIVKIPPLHFSKKRRGRLPEGTKFFTGDLKEMDLFVPKKLNRKMVSSKFASIYDPTGKLGPILAEAKDILRDTIIATTDWVSPMPEELRSKWIQQFQRWEQLRGLQFNRAVMPEDAVDTKLRLLVLCDFALKILNVGAWGGFRTTSGKWSCQHILSRTLLGEKNTTIPKGELQSLTNASNMCWVLRKLLTDWVEDYIICSDSVIALCWVTSEKKSLSMFHRNRVIQIRRGTELSHLYHVKTDENLADLGTRPEKVKLSDVGQGSEWECGREWMHQDVSQAVAEGVLKPVCELRINEEKDGDEYKLGLLLDTEVPDIFCNAARPTRVDKIQQRVEFSNYLVLPTKFGFRKLVRILSLVLKFVGKCRKKVPALVDIDETAETEGRFRFSTFHAGFSEKPDDHPGDVDAQIEDEYVHQALVYLYRKATQEVIKFNSASKVDKLAVLKNGILFSKGRIMEGMNFVQTGGLDIQDLGLLGIKAHIPVIDRYSPLAYCVANYIHWEKAKHRGMETCNRMSLSHVHIIQGASLYKEVGEECMRCKMKRKKLVEVPMGLISDHQLSISPPFWATIADLFGPYRIFVPGFERNTRNRNVLEAKCWVICFVCPVTRLTNLQVIEKSDASGIIDGVTRLSCEVGIPKFLMIDQDPALLKALQEVGIQCRGHPVKAPH